MRIKTNPDPQFTHYLVENKLFPSPIKVIDVGARGGIEGHWSNYRPYLRILGFEANSEECDNLNKNNSQKSVYNHILFSDRNKMVFRETHYPASSGLHPTNTNFTRRLNNGFISEIAGTRIVDAYTLDSFNLQPEFIKLDTEGSELAILEGGIESLKSVLGISVEVEFAKMHRGQPLFNDVDSFLKDKGFTLYNLVPMRLMRRVFPDLFKYLYQAEQIGQIIAGQALYFRDAFAEIERYTEDQILKLASLFEIYCLQDCAIELLREARVDNYKMYIELLEPQIDKGETQRPFINFLKNHYQNKPLTGVEIGVYKGLNAEEMMENLNIKKLYLIDPYLEYNGYDGGWDEPKKQNEFNELHDNLVENLLPFKDKIEIIRAKSSDTVDKVPEKVDFVYVDGNHSFKYVEQDLKLYYPKVKKGGIICGDNLEFKDVANVVIQFFALEKLKLNAASRPNSYEWWGVKWE